MRTECKQIFTYPGSNVLMRCCSVPSCFPARIILIMCSLLMLSCKSASTVETSSIRSVSCLDSFDFIISPLDISSIHFDRVGQALPSHQNSHVRKLPSISKPLRITGRRWRSISDTTSAISVKSRADTIRKTNDYNFILYVSIICFILFLASVLRFTHQ